MRILRFVVVIFLVALAMRYSARRPLAQIAQPMLLKDINTTGAASNPDFFVDLNGVAIFTADHASYGRELWRSDGTTQGTYLLKDVYAGTSSGVNDRLKVVGSTVYFAGTDLANGTELWKTDGTAAGTVLVKDIYPGATSSSPYGFASVGNIAYFVADNGTNGRELWKSDGTAAGTVLVKDIISGSTSGNIENLTTVGSQVYFSMTPLVANPSTYANQLWKSDGTSSGTVMVRQTATISGFGNYIASLTDVNGTLFFRAYDGAQYELWKSNGTSGGTGVVADINGASSSFPGNLTAVGSKLFFTATDAGGEELWTSDGTSGGTFRAKDILSGSGSSSPRMITGIGNVAYFSANDGVNGTELWRSDGTSAGTSLVANIQPGATSSAPYNFVALNGVLYFTAEDSVAGNELWKSDGTPGGTMLVADMYPGANASSAYSLTKVGNRLFFGAQDWRGYQPWTSDGTSTGTYVVADIHPGSNSSFPGQMTVAGPGVTYFSANDAQHFTQIWKTDGTEAGTVLATNLSNGVDNSVVITPLNGSLFFRAFASGSGTELYKTDGTPASTALVKDIFPGSSSSNPQFFTAFNGAIYFSATNSSGNEVWKSDGTSIGTVILKDINAGSSSGNPANFTVVGTTLFFTATDTINGTELWKTDGTPAGTLLVKDIRAGTSSSSPFALVAVNGRLFFAATDGNGTELWTSDGTAAGTVLVKDINPGTGASTPQNLFNFNGTLVFSANDGTSGIELWKSDGTMAGTVRVRDINTGTANSSPSIFANVNGVLFFRATDATNGIELWKSDLSEAGTVLVKNINPGNAGANSSSLTAVNDTLYFSANDGTNGFELWRSDGTAAGTVMVSDIRPGTNNSSSPTSLVYNSGKLLFTADDGSLGREPWVLSVATPNTAPVANAGADQIVEAASASGTQITLSATGSTDSDNDTLTYEWRDGANHVISSTDTITLIAPLGTTIYTVSVDDGHGGTDTDDVAVIVQDTTAPIITLSSPTNTTYTLNQTVTAAFSCSDAVSGISSCAATVGNGGPVDTSTAGSHEFAVSATDNAANTYTTIVTYTVSRGTSTITWPAPAPIVYGTALGSTQLNATANVAGSFVYSPASGTVFDVGNSQSLSVTFDPDDDANYSPATASVSINVLQATPTVTAALPSYTYDGSAHAATGNAYGIGGVADVLSPAVTLTYMGTGATSYAASAVAPNQAGSYAVVAHFAGNQRYTSADSATVPFSIVKADQTITVTNAAPSSVAYNQSFSVSATASSGLGVVITASGACTLTGGGTGSATGHMDSGTGLCGVQFNQPGNNNFNAAPGATNDVTAVKAAQAITFDQPASPRTFADAFSVSATSSSSLALTIGAAGGCSIDASNTVIMTSGTLDCVLTAAQAGDGNYAAASDVVRTVAAARKAQTITFAQPASPRAFGDTFAVSVTADSGLLVSIVAGGGCSIDGSNMVTMTSGTTACVLTASQGGNDNVAAATDVVRTVAAAKKAQAITFAQPASPRAFGDTFVVGATADSGLIVSIVASGGCSIDGTNTVTMTSGTTACVLTASQGGNDDVAAAGNSVRTVGSQKASATVSFVAGTLMQTYDGGIKTVETVTVPSSLNVDVSFVGTPQTAGDYPVTATINDSNYSATASGSLHIAKGTATVTLGSLAQTYDGSPRVATAATGALGTSTFTITYDGGTSAPINAGSYAVAATLVNANFEGSVAGTLNVSRANQTTVNVTGPVTLTYGTTAMATANGGLGTGTFEFTSTGAGCALSGATVSVLDASVGCQLTAVRKGDTNYFDSAPSAPLNVTLQKVAQTITFGALGTKSFGDPDFSLSASSSSGLAVAFAVASGPATVTAGVVHLTGAGTVVIRATQAGNNNHNAATPVDRSFLVTDQITRTGFYEPVNSNVGFVNTVKGGSTVPLKFEVIVNGVEKTDTAGLLFSIAPIACANSVEDAVDFTTTGGTNLRYDTGVGQFIQNWQTPKSPGSCYVVKMTTSGDGGALTAMFKMK